MGYAPQKRVYGEKKRVNYYPFGLEHKGYNNTVTSTNIALKKTYNGKELQNELGLDWHDYGARNYEAALGRWMNIDPLADKYREYTPYNYVANNPLLYVDPDGERIEISNNTIDALTKLAQIAATNRGSEMLDRLTGSYHTYRLRSVFWSSNSAYDGEGEIGGARTIYYPSSVWRFGIGGGAPNSEYVLGHEINHAYEHDLRYNIRDRKNRERSSVNFGNYLRSVYGEDDMRTSYFGLGLDFSDNAEAYNLESESVSDFTETLSVTAGGSTVLGFSYQKTEGGESSTEYILSAKTEGGKFTYRKFTDKNEYNAAVDRLNTYKQEQDEKEKK